MNTTNNVITKSLQSSCFNQLASLNDDFQAWVWYTTRQIPNRLHMAPHPITILDPHLKLNLRLRTSGIDPSTLLQLSNKLCRNCNSKCKLTSQRLGLCAITVPKGFVFRKRVNMLGLVASCHPWIKHTTVLMLDSFWHMTKPIRGFQLISIST